MNLMNLHVLACLLMVSPLLRSTVADEAQDRKDVCGTITGDVDVSTEFTFQQQFKVHVEAVMPEMGRIANSWLEFSPSKNMLKATLKAPDWDYELYDDYENHQTLVYNLKDTGRGQCLVDILMHTRKKLYLIPDAPDTAGTLPTVSDVLRLSGKSGFGTEKISLMKRTSSSKQYFRSLVVDQYDSCQKIRDDDGSLAIVKVTHLMSKTKLSRTESGTVPIQVVFSGKFVSGAKAQTPITHTYNFFHYSTSAGDDDFVTPVGVVCPNRKGPNTFPTPPAYITFGQEVHDVSTQEIYTVKTTYDQEFKYVTEEIFDPTPGKQSIFRFDDFYAGLSYQIDHNTGVCNAVNISASTNVNDFKIVGGKVKMMTPEQFWDAEGIEYHYNGKKHFRGLETEAWIGQDPATKYMYEWYFTFGIESTINDLAVSEQTNPHRIPYKRLFWPTDTGDYFSNYYFQVDFTEPNLIFDLSPCYQNQRQFITLYVEGLTFDRVTKDETLVIRRAVTTLTQKLNIPFTRIASPQIAFRGEKGYIFFQLLAPPKYSGDLVTQHANQPSLNDAVATLKKLSSKGQLTFEVGDNLVPVTGKATYEKIAFIPPSRGGDDGYSGGALAGLSIAMIIVGLAAGGGGGYWYFIKH